MFVEDGRSQSSERASCVGGRFWAPNHVPNDAEGAQNIYTSKSDLATRLADNHKNDNDATTNQQQQQG